MSSLLSVREEHPRLKLPFLLPLLCHGGGSWNVLGLNLSLLLPALPGTHGSFPVPQGLPVRKLPALSRVVVAEALGIQTVAPLVAVGLNLLRGRRLPGNRNGLLLVPNGGGSPPLGGTLS